MAGAFIRPLFNRLILGVAGVACGIVLVTTSSEGALVRTLALVPFVLALLMGVAKSGTA